MVWIINELTRVLPGHNSRDTALMAPRYNQKSASSRQGPISRATARDRVIVLGWVGDHSVANMLKTSNLEFETEILSGRAALRLPSAKR